MATNDFTSDARVAVPGEPVTQEVQILSLVGETKVLVRYSDNDTAVFVKSALRPLT